MSIFNIDSDGKLETKWKPALKGIEDPYLRKVTAQLYENQARQFILLEQEVLNENAPTTVGKLGTFQKFAFPLIRRVYPELLANKISGVQPMPGPVSQVFYIGHDRVYGSTVQTIYNKYQLTYRGYAASGILAGGTLVASDKTSMSGAYTPVASATPSGFQTDLSAYISSGAQDGAPSGTYGGMIAAWPQINKIWGWSVSAGEALTGTGIPEINFHIEQQPVVAITRKMRALWTIEAGQDLKAYHNLDLERELTDLLSKEMTLEIDREMIENIRMIAYDINGSFGGWTRGALDLANSHNFPQTEDGTLASFIPSAYLYDFANVGAGNPAGNAANVWLVDLSVSGMASPAGAAPSHQFAPRHVGDVYANLLAAINFASQDIYRTTHRGPGTWLLTSPIVGAILESSAKLEGGIPKENGPTNMGKKIAYAGKFMGKYDLYIDPLYPEDEILMGYKGDNAMDAGFVYCPYIPLMNLPTIVDPETFQPRKGILSRYGRVAIQPASRFYRVIRLIGGAANYLWQPFAKADSSKANVSGVY